MGEVKKPSSYNNKTIPTYGYYVYMYIVFCWLKTVFRVWLLKERLWTGEFQKEYLNLLWN
jgi:hypothetical protein